MKRIKHKERKNPKTKRRKTCLCSLNVGWTLPTISSYHMERHSCAIGMMGNIPMNFPEKVAPRRTTTTATAVALISIVRSYFWKKRRIDVYTIISYSSTYMEIHPSIRPFIYPASQPASHSTPHDSIRSRTWILRTFIYIYNISQRQFYLCAHCWMLFDEFLFIFSFFCSCAVSSRSFRLFFYFYSAGAAAGGAAAMCVVRFIRYVSASLIRLAHLLLLLFVFTLSVSRAECVSVCDFVWMPLHLFVWNVRIRISDFWIRVFWGRSEFAFSVCWVYVFCVYVAMSLHTFNICSKSAKPNKMDLISTFVPIQTNWVCAATAAIAAVDVAHINVYVFMCSIYSCDCELRKTEKSNSSSVLLKNSK